jgi:S-adenosylmethionine:tRNA-ribosyltransferase-isomerase (queuine synthetase)
VTLHVGLGTFNPVEKICQNTKWTWGIKITQAACDINDAKSKEKRICTREPFLCVL